MPSIILALLLVVAGLGYFAWTVHRSHINEAPRVVRASASVPVSAPPDWPLPPSPRCYEEPVTGPVEVPPTVRVFLAQRGITRGGEWR